MPNGEESIEGDVEEGDIAELKENECRHQGGSCKEDENGRPHDAGEDDVADVGHILGGEEADGTAGDEDGDEEDDYSYTNHVDDDDDKNSEPELDLTDNTLGPEDSEEEGDELYLLGFAALQGSKIFFCHDKGCM